jgi:succinate dehydrogenase / fumarate reductase flavoprotein subunit
VEDSPRNQQTNVPGLFASGEVDYQYHGANRLGANSLLSCLYAGWIGGKAMVAHAASAAGEAPSAEGEARGAASRWTERFRAISAADGDENPYRLHHELGELMNENVTIVRHNAQLAMVLDKLKELKARYRRLGSLDRSGWANPSLLFANHLENLLELAEVVTRGALQRDESRGAHYKPEFPRRDDASWLKTTIATWTPDGPALTYEPVDVSLVSPVARKYD